MARRNTTSSACSLPAHGAWKTALLARLTEYSLHIQDTTALYWSCSLQWRSDGRASRSWRSGVAGLARACISADANTSQEGHTSKTLALRQCGKLAIVANVLAQVECKDGLHAMGQQLLTSFSLPQPLTSRDVSIAFDSALQYVVLFVLLPTQ